MICVKCGCVAARSVQDEGPDWRTYSNKSHEVEKAKHVVTFGELGSATEITCGRPNMYCPPGWRPKTTKLEKRLTRSLQNIKTICSRLFFQKIVVDTASSILRSAVQIPFLEASLRKRRREFLTATIVIASRKHACARSLKEIVVATATNLKYVAKCYSRIVEKLNLQIKPQKSHEFVTRFCCLLRIPRGISQVAAQLAARYIALDSAHFAKPTAVAAASILFISTMSKQRKEASHVAAVAFVTEKSLLRLYADIYSNLNELFRTEDLINLQEHDLDMRKLLRPDDVREWKAARTGKVATKKRCRVITSSGPDADQPRGKIVRSPK